MDHELPSIRSRGPGVKKAFAAAHEFIEVDEQVEAFFYLAMNSSVVVTDRRTLVIKGGQIGTKEPPTVLPRLPLLTLEKRGLLGRTYLIHDDQQVEISLTDGDVKTLRTLIDSTGEADERRGDDGAGSAAPRSLVEGVSTWLKEDDEFRRPVEKALLEGEQLLFFGQRVLVEAENTSLFVTNARIGLTTKNCVIAQFRLNSVETITFSKSMGKQRVLLRLVDGREYRFGKVVAQEEAIVLAITERARKDESDARTEIFEFAALPEDEILWIQARHITNRIGDNNREIADKGQGAVASAQLYTTAIRQGNVVRPLDGDVSAEVQSGGGIQVSHRPTLTRMAAGSILPGTALIPGLAFQKKKTIESRTTYFAVVHPDWMLDVNVDPDDSASAIRAAKIINKRAESLKPSPEPTDAAPQPTAKSPAEQIREMKALLDEGIITQDDFDTFKASILG